MKSTYFAIATAIFCLFYIGLHISFMEGARFEKNNSICIGEFELTKIQEGTQFFDKIYQMQQKEVESLRKKLEKETSSLSSCYNSNYNLKSVLSTPPENKFTSSGKQIEE